MSPGMLVKLGFLTFVCERYNTGVVSKRGYRYRMEDAYCIQQDIHLDQVLKASFYSVIDGHGGFWFSTYLQNEMVPFLLKSMRAELEKN